MLVAGRSLRRGSSVFQSQSLMLGGRWFYREAALCQGGLDPQQAGIRVPWMPRGSEVPRGAAGLDEQQ